MNNLSYSIEAEQSVIGSLIIDNNRWDDVMAIISVKDFYSLPHQVIFSEMKKLVNYKQPIDLITLSESLGEDKLKKLGGFAYLAELSTKTPSTLNVIAYAEIVREHSIKRKLTFLSNNINQYIKNNKNTNTIIEQIDSTLLDINKENNLNDATNVIDVLENIMNRIESQEKSCIRSGFSDLDQKIGGFEEKEVTIIAGRPAMGKTAFWLSSLVNILQNPKNSNKTAIFFSIEMPAEQVVIRLLSIISNVAVFKIKQNKMTEEEFSAITAAMGILISWNGRLIIDDSSFLTPMIFRSKMRRYIRKYGEVCVVGIDYLQLMSCPEITENQNLKIAEISKQLKLTAKEFDFPLVILSQLNRTVEQRADKRPHLGDLRDSGALEQDGYVILFIYRDEVYNNNSIDKGIAEILIGKNRNGPTGIVKLHYHSEATKFCNLVSKEF